MKQIISAIALVLICYLFSLLLYLGRFAPCRESFYILLGVGLVAATSPLFSRKRSVKKLWIAIALFATFTAGMTSIRWMHGSTPLGKFRNVYAAIRLGMNSSEVETMVQHEFPGLEISYLLDENKSFILGPLNHEDKSGFIEVTIKNGQVIAKEFFPSILFD
jgi:hypothetical protein